MHLLALIRFKGFKKSLYAKAGVPTYWIVNLIERQVEAHTEPGKRGNKVEYLKHHEFGVGDEVPLVLGGKEVLCLPVREMLP